VRERDECMHELFAHDADDRIAAGSQSDYPYEGVAHGVIDELCCLEACSAFVFGALHWGKADVTHDRLGFAQTENTAALGRADFGHRVGERCCRMVTALARRDRKQLDPPRFIALDQRDANSLRAQIDTQR
jgi:hypothetical protein